MYSRNLLVNLTLAYEIVTSCRIETNNRKNCICTINSAGTCHFCNFRQLVLLFCLCTSNEMRAWGATAWGMRERGTVKPLLSYFLLSYGVAAGWLTASREGVSGTRQLAHSSLFWPVIGTSYILHVPALSKISEVSLYRGGAIRDIERVEWTTHSIYLLKCIRDAWKAIILNNKKKNLWIGIRILLPHRLYKLGKKTRIDSHNYFP